MSKVNLRQQMEQYQQESGAPQTAPSGKLYYWIVAETKGGKMVVNGPFTYEQEAWDRIYEKDLEQQCNTCSVVALNTKDRARATSIQKSKRLEKTGNIDQAIQRSQHKI